MIKVSDSRGGYWLLALSCLLLTKCGGGAEAGTDAGSDEMCNPGELECACNEGLCLMGLTCVEAVCVSDDTEDSSGPESSGTEDTSSEDTSTASSETSEDESDSDPCTPPEMLCDGVCVNVETSNDHCGTCGNTCKTALDTGGCAQGICTPVWSDCVDGEVLTPCAQVCEGEGFMACATAQCGEGNASYIWYSLGSYCADGSSVIESDDIVCDDQPMFQAAGYYRCCCAQQ